MVFIKFGGSVITDTKRPQTAKIEEIRRLLRETFEAKDIKNFDLVIGHGSGSFGHAASIRYRINEKGLTNNESVIGFPP